MGNVGQDGRRTSRIACENARVAEIETLSWTLGRSGKGHLGNVGVRQAKVKRSVSATVSCQEVIQSSVRISSRRLPVASRILGGGLES